MWKKIAVLSFAVVAMAAVGTWSHFQQTSWEKISRERQQHIAQLSQQMAENGVAPRGTTTSPEWEVGAAAIKENGVEHQGPNYPTRARYIGDPSHLIWINPENVFAEDGLCSTNGGGMRAEICPIITGGYGFNIPADAKITGIVVEYKLNSVTGLSLDLTSMLASAGEPAGKNYRYEFRLPHEPNWIVYGTPEDTWRHDWTPAEINDPGFGSVFAFQVDGMVDSVKLDAVRITVYFKRPGAPSSSE